MEHNSESKYGHFRGNPHRPMMAMIEITNKCNMACPVCFTDANNPSDEVPLAEVKARIDNLLNVAGPIPVQISGGEPTLHRDLPEIIRYAKSQGFKNIELITNGLLISKKPEFLQRLVDDGLTAVYLQFDGVSKATYIKIRGQDMTEVRARSIDAIRRADVCCTLAVAVTQGINDHELNDIVQFGIKNIDTVRAINFQSATRFTGRFDVPDTGGGYSLPALVNRLSEQTGLAADSFRSEMLGHPLCNAMSLVYVVDGKLEPLFKHVSRESLVAFLGEDKRTKVLDLFMGKERFCSKHLANPKIWKVLLEAMKIFGTSPSLTSVLKAKHILLFAKSFMERSALDDNRVEQCSYGIAGADGVYSFCAFNNVHRFPQKLASIRS